MKASRGAGRSPEHWGLLDKSNKARRLGIEGESLTQCILKPPWAGVGVEGIWRLFIHASPNCCILAMLRASITQPFPLPQLSIVSPSSL